MKNRSFLFFVGILLSLLIGSLFSEPITPVYAVVTVSSISPENNTITLDTTPNFTCTPTSNVSATVNVTLYIDDIASGTVNNHANNTEITITCNHTLSESDTKKPWYFNVTDADGTYSSETRNIGIGAYFIVPAVLVNPNEYSQEGTYTGEHWSVAAGNIFAGGTTQNGTYFWITDYYDTEIFTYFMNGTYTEDHWDTSGSGNTEPYGITQNGTYIWISDNNGAEVYKYHMNGTYTGEHWDTASIGNADPYGITQNGTYFWITDAADDAVYIYHMNGTYTGDNWDVSGSGSVIASGITHDNTYFWITDWSTTEVYKYYMNGTYTEYHWDTSGSGNGNPRGITKDNDYIWIADRIDNEVYKYHTTSESEHWTYYLNASTSDYAFDRPIQIVDNNITLNGQYYMLDADGIADDGILVERSSPGQITTITIENISLSGWDDSSIHLRYADGNTLGNITANDCWDFSIWLEYSDSNIISNVTASDCNNRGFEFDHAFNNTISNVTVENNNNRGIGLSSCDFNIISDSTINNCYRGIFFSYADSNTVYDCIIQNSIGSGIYMAFSGSTQNIFYNNLFNNTVNIDQSGTPQLNYWNTTKQIGTRIHSNGLYIGGNYWTNSTGTGDSDTGTDSNHDGFLDDTLTISISNYDYLAYSDEGNPTLYLQARDSDGTNLPRQVAFKGTIGNGTSFDENSNSNGYLTLPTCFGTHTVNIWWGNHLVDASREITVTSDQTENIDTKIQRLDSTTYYILFSLNDTDLPTVEFSSAKLMKFLSVSGSGTVEFKLDNENWVESGSPKTFKVSDYTYTSSSPDWSYVNHIFSHPVIFSERDLTLTWGTEAEPPPSGPPPSNGGFWVPPYVPPVEDEEWEEISPVIPGIPPELPPPPPRPAFDITPIGAVMIVGIVIFSASFKRLKRLNLSSLWRTERKRKRADWPKKKRSKVEWKERK
ncbi:hypothetical protein E3J74_01505 [Candidatus Bathyarchaeota archaeon]|nr:MAG: hypothetical protein E3J74_01505 [Candidatus Bathyarchaeota archaeon]